MLEAPRPRERREAASAAGFGRRGARRTRPRRRGAKPLAARLAEAAPQRLTAAIDEAGQMYAPERLHQVRIAAKKLRYGLEIASGVGVRAGAPRGCARSSELQDLLGRMHDLQVLQAHVADRACRVRAGHRRVAPGARPAGAAHRRGVPAPARPLRRGARARCARSRAGGHRPSIVPQLARPARRRPVKMALAACGGGKDRGRAAVSGDTRAVSDSARRGRGARRRTTRTTPSVR